MIGGQYNKHKETIHNFCWRSLQMFGRYGVIAIIFFAAAKFLTPEDFGLFNYLRTVFFLLMIFCDFGLSYAVSKFVTEYKVCRPEKLNSIAFTIAIFSFGIAAIISVVVTIFGKMVFRGNYLYILYMLPYLFLMPLTDILDGMYRGLKDFKKPALISSIVGLVSIGISLFLISRYRLVGAIWSLNIMYLLLLLFYCGFQRNFKFEFDKSVLVEVLKYALVLGVGVMGGFLYSRASILILKHFGYVVEIGYYGLIDTIFQILFLPFGILGQVIAPNTTAYIVVKNVTEIKNKMEKYITLCAITGVAMSVLLYFGIPVIIKNFLPRYNTADFLLIMNILLISLPFYIWGAILNQGFVAPAGFARISVITTLICGILNVVFAWAFINFFGFLAVFWVLLGIQSANVLIITVYFYIKVGSVKLIIEQ